MVKTHPSQRVSKFSNRVVVRRIPPTLLSFRPPRVTLAGGTANMMTMEEWVEANVRPAPAPEPPLPPIESKDDRWRREAAEQKVREAAYRHCEKVDHEAAIAEARKHELNVARSWGRAAAEANNIVDAEVLNAISDALSGILTRLERLERKADAQQSGAATTVKRLDILSAKEKSSNQRSNRQIAILERKLDDDREQIRDLRTTVSILKAQVNKPQPEPSPIHVIHER